MAAAPLITIDQFNTLMRAEIPLSTFLGITALEVGAGSAVLRLPFTPAALRPGGVQSGPALMALADLAMYAAVMGLYGNEPRVLSSDLSMNFFRRAPNQALLGHCSVLGLDSTRALAKTEIVPEAGGGRLVCLVTANYACLPIPGNKRHRAPTHWRRPSSSGSTGDGGTPREKGIKRPYGSVSNEANWSAPPATEPQARSP